MSKIDTRHIVFHILIALYLIWIVVYAALLAIAIINVFGSDNIALTRVFMLWIFLNLLMGSVLFIVIRLFRNKTILNRLVLYSYCIMGAASIITVIIIRSYT
jgi:hypothetical protein